VSIKVTIKEEQEVKAFQGRFSFFGHPFKFCSYSVGDLLIDTGPKKARREITEFADHMKPKMIVLTHAHEDHSGNANWLSERFEIPVIMSEATAEIMKKNQPIPFYRRLVWGQREKVKLSQLMNDLQTELGPFEMVPTPGHTKDHIVLVNETKKWLFSGDLYLNRRLHYGLREESIPDMMSSINNVLNYSFNTLFCGHAGIVKDGREALKQKSYFLQKLTEDTWKLAQIGLPEKYIARKLLPRHPAIESFSFGEMSAIHLIQSILSNKSLNS
jgi:endoribonuclease LACTB2